MKKYIHKIAQFYYSMFKERPADVVQREKEVTRKIAKIAGISGLAFLYIHLLFFIGFSFFCVMLQKVDPKFSSLMLIRKLFDQHNVYRVKPLELQFIPQKFQNMIVYLEDGDFYEHHGIDFEAIKYAMELNKNYDEPVVGASTLTMQLARTLFLFQKKTYFRKYIEGLMALEMELFLSKDRVMELYLNSVEWGKGIFGINNASHYYYNDMIMDLSTDQMMRLATILSSPLKYDVESFYSRKILKKRYNLLAGIYLTSSKNENSMTNIPVSLEYEDEEFAENLAEMEEAALTNQAVSNTDNTNLAQIMIDDTATNFETEKVKNEVNIKLDDEQAGQSDRRESGKFEIDLPQKDDDYILNEDLVEEKPGKRE